MLQQRLYVILDSMLLVQLLLRDLFPLSVLYPCDTGISQMHFSGIDTDYTTVKYSTDGDEFWIARYSGPEAARA